MSRRKIVLRFIVGADEDNNYHYKNVTLKNIRSDLNDAQMCEFVARYCSLTANILEEAVVIDERRLILEEEVGDEEKGVTTASIAKAEVEIENPKEGIHPVIKSESPSACIEEVGDEEKGAKNTSIAKAEVEIENPKEGIHPVIKSESPPARLEEVDHEEKGVTAVSSSVELVKSKKKAINKGGLVILTDDQGTFMPKLGEKSLSDPKNQEWLEVKQQSPPREAESAVLEVSVPESGICEEEIEIWLEDDQDQSIEALMILIEKALESKGVTGMTLKNDAPSLATDSRDPCYYLLPMNRQLSSLFYRLRKSSDLKILYIARLERTHFSF